MKKTLSLLLCMFMLAAFIPAPASAKNTSADAVIYAINSWAEPFLTIPAEFSRSYQIPVPESSEATFSVISGESAAVSDKGLVTPLVNTMYWFGNVGHSSPIPGKTPDRITYSVKYGLSVIRVSEGTKITEINVEVKDYATVYADGIIDAYIAKNIPDDMPFYNKLEKICQFPAKYDYSANFQSASGMIVSGGGDCWASTDLIIKMCKKLGIEAKARNGNRDAGAGNGHRNALITNAEGDYYELESGYVGTAPRLWSIKHRTSLFCCRSFGDGVEVYQYDGAVLTADKITVPETIDKKTVLSVGESFISFNKIVTEVLLPETVENIAESAFYSCTSLKTLHLPASVKAVGKFAFGNCSGLTNFNCDANSRYFTVENGILYDKKKQRVISAPSCVGAVLPDTVETVGAYAFSRNLNLKSITLGSGTKTIEEGAFVGCCSLCRANLKSVHTIGRAAFADCGRLTTLLIPDGVSEISELTFSESNIDSVYIPKSLTKIGEKAFYKCPVTDVCCAGTEKQWNAVEKASSEIPTDAEIHFNCGIYILTIKDGNSVFTERYCNFQNVHLQALDDNPAKEFDRWLVEGNQKIENPYVYKITITMPTSDICITALYKDDANFGRYTPESAFVFNRENGTITELTNEGKSLCEIVIPRRIDGVYVIKIADMVFHGCTGLTAVSIPKTVIEIGRRAFEDCTSLKNIFLPDSVTVLGESAFEGCVSLLKASIGCGITEIGESAFFGCVSLEDVLIPDGLKKIGGWAFYQCISLPDIKIPDGITSVGQMAFSHCDKLRFSAYGNAKYLGNKANHYLVLTEAENREISSFDFNPQTKIIAGGAFLSCKSLKTLTIPVGITNIGDMAFQDCTALINADMRNGVTSVGSYAFRGCASLMSVFFGEELTTVGDGAFFDCDLLTSISFPDSLTKFGKYVFFDCALLEEVNFGEGITVAGDFAFANCDALKRLTLPVSIAKIGYKAFSNDRISDIYYFGTKSQWDSVTKNNSQLNDDAAVHFCCVPPERYSVTVNGGFCDKSAAASEEKLTVKANDPPFGFRFDKWTASNSDTKFENPKSEKTSFIMPNGEISVKVEYAELFRLSDNTFTVEKRIAKSKDLCYILTDAGLTVGQFLSMALANKSCTVYTVRGERADLIVQLSTDMTVKEINGQTITIVVRGDVGGDGNSDNVDASRMLYVDAGISTIGKAAEQAGDINVDGAVDNLDAAAVLMYDAGIIDRF